MNSIKILEMINEGRIEELKGMLRDDIYAQVLNNKPPGAKQRYTAMKKYFSYVKHGREILQKPCIVEYEGKPYTSFCNSYSLALTSEPCGAIELCTEPERYPNVAQIVRFGNEERIIDFTKVFADAKSLGYRLNKGEVGSKFKYLMKYGNAYYKLGLIDATYSIVDDGKAAEVYHSTERVSPITIRNEIGVCTIMPMNVKDIQELIDENQVIIIEVEID